MTNLLSVGPTGGNDTDDASFRGVSADGSKVFFQTAESLVGTDADLGFQDVYQRREAPPRSSPPARSRSVRRTPPTSALRRTARGCSSQRRRASIRSTSTVAGATSTSALERSRRSCRSGRWEARRLERLFRGRLRQRRARLLHDRREARGRRRGWGLPGRLRALYGRSHADLHRPRRRLPAPGVLVLGRLERREHGLLLDGRAPRGGDSDASNDVYSTVPTALPPRPVTSPLEVSLVPSFRQRSARPSARRGRQRQRSRPTACVHRVRPARLPAQYAGSDGTGVERVALVAAVPGDPTTVANEGDLPTARR